MTIKEIITIFLKEYELSTIIGVAVGILIFIFEIILCSKGIIFSGGNKKLEEAKRKGHILKGKMTYYTYDYRDSESKNIIHIADYEYLIDGKKKSKRIVSTSVKPPYEINLYYVDSPKKIFSEYDLKSNPLKILIYIIPLVVSVWIATSF